MKACGCCTQDKLANVVVIPGSLVIDVLTIARSDLSPNQEYFKVKLEVNVKQQSQRAAAAQLLDCGLLTCNQLA